jgi:hypothetical protein
MGKIYKITTILLFVTIIYVTNLWAIGLIVSFIFPLLSLPFKKNTWEFLICLLIVSACWVGLEYILEGVVHNSDVDGYVAVVLSGFITDKYMDIVDKLRR